MALRETRSAATGTGRAPTKQKRAAEELGCPDPNPMPLLQQERLFTKMLPPGQMIPFSVVVVPFHFIREPEAALGCAGLALN